MIKIYEDYVDDKFRYKMKSIDKIKDFCFYHLYNFFDDLKLKHFNFVSKSTTSGAYQIYAFKDGHTNDNQYLCFSVFFGLTNIVTSGVDDTKYGVHVILTLNNFSYHYDSYKYFSLDILEFLANIINPNRECNRDYFEFVQNISIEDLDRIKSKITVDNYNILKDSEKYNL